MPRKGPGGRQRERQEATKALELFFEAMAAPSRRKQLKGKDQVARHLRSQLRRWHGSGEILGYGVGLKQVGGLSTDHIALQIYVRRKRPREVLPARSVIPPVLSSPELSAQALLDVIEMEPFRHAALDRFQRPIFPGLSVGHCITGETGSLGAVVRALRDPANIYVLGAAHVFAAAGRARIGDAIVQPGGLDGGRCPQQTIGKLARFVIFQQGANFPNRADAALVKLDSTTDVTTGELPIRRLATRGMVREDQVLFRIGCRTGKRPVQVESTSFATTIEYSTPAGGRANFGFRDLLLYRDFSLKGDSGGMVITDSGALVGIHIARTDNGFGLAVPVWSLPAEWNLAI